MNTTEWITTQISDTAITDDTLTHHGVLGMKWGKRKKSATKNSKKSSKKISEMSDQELRDAVARLDLEKKYLTYVTPKRNPTVQKLIDNAVSNIGDAVSKQAASAISKKISQHFFGVQPITAKKKT